MKFEFFKISVDFKILDRKHQKKAQLYSLYSWAFEADSQKRKVGRIGWGGQKKEKGKGCCQKEGSQGGDKGREAWKIIKKK